MTLRFARKRAAARLQHQRSVSPPETLLTIVPKSRSQYLLRMVPHIKWLAIHDCTKKARQEENGLRRRFQESCSRSIKFSSSLLERRLWHSGTTNEENATQQLTVPG